MLTELMEKYDRDVTFVKVHDQRYGFFNGQEYYDIILNWMNEQLV